MWRKKIAWIFSVTNWQDGTQEDVDITEKGKCKERNWIPSEGTTKNAKGTNYVKAKIDDAQQNCLCRFCGEKDKIINHIIIECSKLAWKECKTRHDARYFPNNGWSRDNTKKKFIFLPTRARCDKKLNKYLTPYMYM